MSGSDPRPLLAVLAPALAAGLILVGGPLARLRHAWSLLAAAAALGLLVGLLPEVLAGGAPATEAVALVPGFALKLEADAFGLLFALVASVLFLLAAFYNAGHMRIEGGPHQAGYFACFALCVSAALGIALAANLATLFVFYEVLTLATYPLVAHKRSGEAVAAGRKYLAYTLGAGQLLLLGVAGAAVLAPGAGFTPGGFLAGTASAPVLVLLFALFVVGCGVKAALMPLHAWLPAAMVAPTPVSALLHAVAVVKAGAFTLVRVVGWVFGVDLMRELGLDVVLVAAASVTILLASLRALGEPSLKRRLAYSTVGQLSYIVLGAGLGSAAALAGAMFHLAAHGFMKITLFLCAGSIHARTHKSEVKELAGLGRRMPVTMGAFALASLGLAGVPALAGFVSKWNLGVGAIDAGHGAAVAVLVVSGLMNVAYLVPISHAAFFAGEGPVRFDEASPSLWLPLSATALASLALGMAPSAGLAFYDLAWQAASSLTGGAP